MTVWPPQLTVSVSPAAAPVPASPTTTGVPSEASPALMPPPLFSAIEVIDGAVGAAVSTVTAWPMSWRRHCPPHRSAGPSR